MKEERGQQGNKKIGGLKWCSRGQTRIVILVN